MQNLQDACVIFLEDRKGSRNWCRCHEKFRSSQSVTVKTFGLGAKKAKGRTEVISLYTASDGANVLKQNKKKTKKKSVVIQNWGNTVMWGTLGPLMFKYTMWLWWCRQQWNRIGRCLVSWTITTYSSRPSGSCQTFSSFHISFPFMDNYHFVKIPQQCRRWLTCGSAKLIWTLFKAVYGAIIWLKCWKTI